ncbi:prophage antirepressor-like protein [Acinetobacter baylyi]|uniref:Prophage antirepressor-like protein n=1 Tax=Acinetobacter baylyi TaxID=202950 RepID=A0ABU0UVI5_ACIBI|nr:BRO family protein [Acinetobacter baylyi]MDQ1208318.1 prophage antirepressor-like protein [Acinetobacter baylyi]MDR6108092.1 prophage antirepressor-like protein [Acinetobacter baylyi]MDR6185190.1 prophage antirepressor-like protein [Acinetobacter baylyi]
MNQVIYFDFKSSLVRIAFDSSNEPLFCLVDVCKVLNISRSSDLLQIQRGDFKNKSPKRIGGLGPMCGHKTSAVTNGGKQELIFIDEPNLYRIISQSSEPEAIHFQNWVFAEVLPTIRKPGSYSARQTAFDELNRLCMQEKLSKEKGTFHSHGMHRRKHEKHLNALRINTCKENIQLTFEGIYHE